MKIKQWKNKVKAKLLRYILNIVKKLHFGNLLFSLSAIILGAALTIFLIRNDFPIGFHKSTISILITLNGIFSAVLITYLFNRVSWTRDRKLEVYNNAVLISQKITNYRRILFTLIDYYGVWKNEEATKNLLDYNKYEDLDFYEFRIQNISVNYNSKQKQLINDLMNDERYSDVSTPLYLAMKTIVNNKTNLYFFQKELYTDFDYDGYYKLELIERWMECNIMNQMWHAFIHSHYDVIDYFALRNDEKSIIEKAKKIDKKYADYKLGNKLIGEIGGEMETHYLPELRELLLKLKKGVTDLSFTIMTLVVVSLLFGVFLPFITLLFLDTEKWVSVISSIIIGINVGVMTFFILKFPFMIEKEVKFS